jgi:hypothetical protein
MATTKVRDWKAARQFPQTYPGDRPDQSYLLLNENIHLLYWKNKADIASAYFLLEEGRHINVDEVLKHMNLPTLSERFAVLAYGANRNPATLAIKFRHYYYKSPGKGLAVPVIKGVLQKADVVACNIFGQGYLYADLLYQSQLTNATEVEAWLTLLDRDQLRVINDSEGLKTGLYGLGQFPGYIIEGTGQEIAPLGYASASRIFISPEFKTPLSFSTVAAINRILPEMQPVSMLDHILDVFDVRDDVARVTGLDNDEILSEELGKYLNGQWWFWFNTREKPILGYQRVLELLESYISKSSRKINTLDSLKEKKLMLPEENSYSPGINYTLKELIKSSP